jgi:hypothetical protein
MSEVRISDDDYVSEKGAGNERAAARRISRSRTCALPTIISMGRACAALAAVALSGCLVFATPSYAADETFTCQTYEALYNQQAAAVLEAIGLADNTGRTRAGLLCVPGINRAGGIVLCGTPILDGLLIVNPQRGACGVTAERA